MRERLTPTNTLGLGLELRTKLGFLLCQQLSESFEFAASLFKLLTTVFASAIVAIVVSVFLVFLIPVIGVVIGCHFIIDFVKTDGGGAFTLTFPDKLVVAMAD